MSTWTVGSAHTPKAVLSPSRTAAYAGLGMAYGLDHQNHWSDDPDFSLAESGRLAETAIAKDDNEPLGHYVAAVASLFAKDLDGAAAEAEAALALNPNYALGQNIRGSVYIYAGEPLKAIPYIELAMRLDPAYRQQYLHFLATAYLVSGEYERAAALFKERISLAPSTDLSRGLLVAALGHLGEVEEAGKVWRELEEINPQYSFAEHLARLPFTNPADAEKIRDGLRKAGVTLQ